MTDPLDAQPTVSTADARSQVERAVHGDRSLASVMGAILEHADMTGAVPMHALTTRYIEQHADGRPLAPDEVRSHLAAAVLPLSGPANGPLIFDRETIRTQ